MRTLNFSPELNLGEVITNEELTNIFKCGNSGGMRRSLSTKSLVLISDHTTNIYKNAFKNSYGIWEFQGMGQFGDQEINYRYNRTLFESNRQDISIYLFIKSDSNKYRYEGEYILIDKPEVQFSEEENRKIVVFKLFHVHDHENIIDFLTSFKKNELAELGILDSSNLYLSSKNVIALIQLMRKNNKEILFGPGGWFISKDGYYYNSHSKEKWGNIFDNTLEENGIFTNQNKYINPYFKSSLVKHSLKDESNLRTEYNSPFIISDLEFSSGNKIYKIELSKQNSYDDVNNLFYSSVIIGKNGVGKSFILSTIEKIFLDLHLLYHSKRIRLTKNINFAISYFCNSTKFLVVKNKQEIDFYVIDKYGEKKLIGLNDLILPKSLISCAFSIQDKFSGTRNSKNSSEYYQYLGIRNIGYRNINKLLGDNIKSAVLTNIEFLSNFKKVTDFLGFEPEIKFQYKIKNIDEVYNEKFIKEKINKSTFKNSKSVYYQDIIRFYEKIKFEDHNKNTFKFSNKFLEVHLNCDTSEIYPRQYEDFELLNAQVELGIFTEPELMAKKNGEWININQVSSGEFQILSTMINILCKVKDNSLVVIDEPETSLHPNWQIKYMSILSLIFKNYSNCHFIIATHSHFLVSDLNPKQTNLMQLKQIDNDYIISEQLEKPTYGRSVEDILYDVFDIPTSRNFYIAKDLDFILRAISLKKMSQDVYQKVKKINMLMDYLKDEDPLKTLILKINEKVGYINLK